MNYMDKIIASTFQACGIYEKLDNVDLLRTFDDICYLVTRLSYDDSAFLKQACDYKSQVFLEIISRMQQ